MNNKNKVIGSIIEIAVGGVVGSDVLEHQDMIQINENYNLVDENDKTSDCWVGKIKLLKNNRKKKEK